MLSGIGKIIGVSILFGFHVSETDPKTASTAGIPEQKEPIDDKLNEINFVFHEQRLNKTRLPSKTLSEYHGRQ